MEARYSIQSCQSLLVYTVYKGEAEKVLQVKRAEAEAEAKYLGGVGVARQRQAITDGLRENILEFSGKENQMRRRNLALHYQDTRYTQPRPRVRKHAQAVFCI